MGPKSDGTQKALTVRVANGTSGVHLLDGTQPPQSHKMPSGAVDLPKPISAYWQAYLKPGFLGSGMLPDGQPRNH